MSSDAEMRKGAGEIWTAFKTVVANYYFCYNIGGN